MWNLYYKKINKKRKRLQDNAKVFKNLNKKQPVKIYIEIMGN